MFLSVIIPVYNAERYIDKCIHSILSQTFTDFELILINDGSKDSSGTICEKYALKDSRIRFFDRTNHGVSATRQFGIEHCRGKYCIQIDADDWIDIDFFEKLIRKVKETNADIVYCGFIKEFIDSSYKVKMFKADDTNTYLSAFFSGKTWCSVWNKLISVKLIEDNKISFPESVCMWEDMAFVAKCLVCANAIAFCEDTYYHYTQYNSASLCRTVTMYDMPAHTVSAINDIVNFFQERGKYSVYYYQLSIAKLLAKHKLIFNRHYFNIKKWMDIFPESNRYIIHYILILMRIRFFRTY